MGDFSNMWRDLREIRRLRADRRRGLVIEIACWLIAAASFYVIIRWLT